MLAIQFAVSKQMRSDGLEVSDLAIKQTIFTVGCTTAVATVVLKDVILILRFLTDVITEANTMLQTDPTFFIDHDDLGKKLTGGRFLCQLMCGRSRNVKDLEGEEKTDEEIAQDRLVLTRYICLIVIAVLAMVSLLSYAMVKLFMLFHCPYSLWNLSGCVDLSGALGLKHASSVIVVWNAFDGERCLQMLFFALGR